MKLKKYITRGTSWRVEAKIEEVEIDRESDACVWITGRRRLKITDYERVHDSWEAAHSYLMAAAVQKVEAARRSLEEHNSYLGNVKGMKRPV